MANSNSGDRWYNKLARGSFRGIVWLLVLVVALSISAYSLYYVARILGVPKLFAAGFSTAYDGVALIAADKALQFAKEGKSGSFPRLVMVIFAMLSAFLNSLHAVFGHENPLAIPMWAGLPVAAVAAYEIHTSQERARANARNGHAYPAPVPKYGGWSWALFPLKTLGGLRTIVVSRLTAVTVTHQRLAVVPAPVAHRSVTAGATRSATTGQPRNATAGAAGNATDDDVRNATGSQPRSATGQPSDANGSPGTHQPARGTASATGQHSSASADEAADTVTAFPSDASGSATGSATIECWHCHRPFVPLRRTARYCGSNCRTAACRARKEASLWT